MYSNLIKLLSNYKINRKTKSLYLSSKKIDPTILKMKIIKLSAKIRGSIMIMGPLVSRFGRSYVIAGEIK